jgi:hypothetical protein
MDLLGSRVQRPQLGQVAASQADGDNGVTSNEAVPDQCGGLAASERVVKPAIGHG